MKIIHIEKQPPPPPLPPPPPPVVEITLTLTAQEAQDLFHLVGRIGGDPKVWPQRTRTFDKLYNVLHEAKVVDTDYTKNPLVFRHMQGGTGIFLA